MSRPCLEILPPELVDSILSHLSIPSLLAFGQTNKQNRSSAIHALYRLELAVFPKPIHSMLAFIETSYLTENTEDEHLRGNIYHFTSACRESCRSGRQKSNTSSLYQIGLTTPSTAVRSSSKSSIRSRTCVTKAHRQQTQACSQQQPLALSLRTQEINTQNQIAARVLSSSCLVNVQRLTLHLYNLISSDLANIIATSFPNLKHLNLNFTHSYINDCTLSARYWRDTPGVADGSPAWNAFSDISVNKNDDDRPRLSTLQSLTLRRAGITSTQLRKWIQHNPRLSKLSLEKVRGVDVEFCDWLVSYTTSTSSSSTTANELLSSSTTVSKLSTINIEDCANLEMNTTRDFDWFSRISRSNTLHTFSLKGCNGVNEPMFDKIVSKRRSNGDRDDGDGDIHDEMDIDSDVDPSVHIVSKFTSPKGTIYHNGRVHNNLSTSNTRPSPSQSQYQYHRAGSMSPTILKEDKMSGYGYWKEGEMEVDPDL